ncbi:MULTISPECIES: hypothetical protein [unclassified Shewanella]|uniref:hypothetical protein n=1 Tax=unclassified Shewanella TaxID=196818 RepID=UPI000F6D9EFA|nr:MULTISPECIES: hypothetical protein [unclassified Shewanella]MDH0450178.1 hypothetical protein [Shewanella sp. GD04112]MDH1468668.1 hypothetical protein [Shewanella sp. GD03713]VEE61564.1 Uncharacterised protein [Shewanella putrefaciens]
MRYLIPSLISVLLTGCATTYKAPLIQDKNYSAMHQSTQADTLAKAKRALLLDGFQIQSSDDNAGFISTSSKNWKLTPDQANCGTTMGIDYLKDNRTKTSVAFNIIVDSSNIVIRSNIQGEYKPGAVDQDITLTCVSKGTIEQELGKKILN